MTERHDFAPAELSWAIATPEQITAKVAEIMAVPGPTLRASFGRMLAHAVRAHAPAHLPLIPPQWQDTAP